MKTEVGGEAIRAREKKQFVLKLTAAFLVHVEKKDADVRDVI